MRAIPYIPFILFFFLFYAFMQPVELLPKTDDTANFELLENLGLWGWLQQRMEFWQLRLFSDFFFIVFLHNLALWKIVNSAVASLLMLGLWRASFGPDFLKDLRERGRALFLAAALICMLFFFIFPNTITSSSFWYSGSFNYLWPVTALVFGLTPFIFFLRGGDPYGRKIWFPLGLFASFCAGFTEQTTLVALGVSAIILLYSLLKKRKVPLLLIIHFAVIAACAAVFLVSVFSSTRLTGGTELALFPEFATYGKRDMLQLGVHVYNTHLLRSSSLLFLALALIAGVLAFTRLKGRHVFFKILALFPAFYIFLNIVPFRLVLSGAWNHSVFVDRVPNQVSAFNYDPALWFDYLYRVPPLGWGLEPHDLFMASLGLAAVLCVFFTLFFAFRAAFDRLLACLLYLAAFGSGVIMGFTPTIFASGNRPFFIANILILLLCAMLIKEGMTSGDEKLAGSFLGRTKASVFAVGLVSLIAVYTIFLYVFVFSSIHYWWF